MDSVKSDKKKQIKDFKKSIVITWLINVNKKKKSGWQRFSYFLEENKISLLKKICQLFNFFL